MACFSSFVIVFCSVSLAGSASTDRALLSSSTRTADESRDRTPGGPLVICGGGALPDEIFTRLRELTEQTAPTLVVIPTASQRADDESYERRLIDTWKQRGFGQVDVLHTRDRTTAESPQFAQPLRTADVVWFGGGSQSRIVDAYLSTKFEKAIYDFHERGGVIGGTSAGAAIMSRVMIASGNPVPNVRTGFDLLPNAVIDQHFLRRKRQPRLRAVIRQHPQLTGFGIDEGTAMIVRGQLAEVMGDSTVTIFRRLDGNKALTAEAWEPGTTVRLEGSAAAATSENPSSPRSQ